MVDEEMLEATELHPALPRVLRARTNTPKWTPAYLGVRVQPFNFLLVEAVEVFANLTVYAELALLDSERCFFRGLRELACFFGWKAELCRCPVEVRLREPARLTRSVFSHE